MGKVTEGEKSKCTNENKASRGGMQYNDTQERIWNIGKYKGKENPDIKEHRPPCCLCNRMLSQNDLYRRYRIMQAFFW